jgi:hypothetical protein
MKTIALSTVPPLPLPGSTPDNITVCFYINVCVLFYLRDPERCFGQIESLIALHRFHAGLVALWLQKNPFPSFNVLHAVLAIRPS